LDKDNFGQVYVSGGSDRVGHEVVDEYSYIQSLL